MAEAFPALFVPVCPGCGGVELEGILNDKILTQTSKISLQ
jgi:hypothetical protein